MKRIFEVLFPLGPNSLANEGLSRLRKAVSPLAFALCLLIAGGRSGLARNNMAAGRLSRLRKAVSRLALALCLLIAGGRSGLAQTTAPFTPAYIFLSGIEYDYYGKTGFSVNSIFGARLGNSKPFYSYTTLETTATAATLRSGIGYTFLQSGNWSAVALGDAGVFNSAGASLGSFSGGGLILYDLGSKLAKGDRHFYIAGGVRLLGVSSQTVQPVGVVMLGAGF